jgi:hypothetical protein
MLTSGDSEGVNTEIMTGMLMWNKGLFIHGSGRTCTVYSLIRIKLRKKWGELWSQFSIGQGKYIYLMYSLPEMALSRILLQRLQMVFLWVGVSFVATRLGQFLGVGDQRPCHLSAYFWSMKLPYTCQDYLITQSMCSHYRIRHDILSIYGPMIYTAPRIRILMRADG